MTGSTLPRLSAHGLDAQQLRTIVYFNDKRFTMRARNHLWKPLPPFPNSYNLRPPHNQWPALEETGDGTLSLRKNSRVLHNGSRRYGPYLKFHSYVQWTYHTLSHRADIPDVDDVIQVMTTEALSV